jgi:hypothetical protein
MDGASVAPEFAGDLRAAATHSQQCRYAVSFLLGELMVFSLHGILFLGRIGMLRVSQLPSLAEDLLHLLTYFVNPRASAISQSGR